jgi:hypothetical protein
MLKSASKGGNKSTFVKDADNSLISIIRHLATLVAMSPVFAVALQISV